MVVVCPNKRLLAIDEPRFYTYNYVPESEGQRLRSFFLQHFPASVELHNDQLESILSARGLPIVFAARFIKLF